MTRSLGPWRQNAPVIIALFALAIVVAGVNDAYVAHAAAQDVLGLHGWGIAISRLGLSGYMLVISAAIVVWSAMAQRNGRRSLFGLSLTALGERAAFFFVVIASSGLICQAIKHIVGRARPKLLQDYGAFHIQPFTFRPAMESFPSGHTTTVFALAVVFSLFYPPGRAIFFAFAVIVALSRVLAGAHYPSDVLAGAMLGTLVALWMAEIFAARNIAFSTGAPDTALKRDRLSPAPKS